ncbi:MAG TPA: hypothetical protein VMH83_06240 [Candidatus Acidoferrum sp.]|nr:hypothetical protein [Candidatus Acidoferrum sp.]
MISQPSKGNRIPTPVLISEASTVMSAGVTTEQVVFSASGMGLVSSLAVAAGSAGVNYTLRLKLDGNTVFSVTQGSSTALADILADTTLLRRNFPNGMPFRASCSITIQYASVVGVNNVVSYHVDTVDSL